MNILVTGGGTSEKIDDVRHLTNQATGRLGSLIAEAFAAQSTNKVTYLYGPGAHLPADDEIRCEAITSVNSLLRILQSELTTHNYHAVIHSMAVSDYQLEQVYPQAEFSEKLFERINQDTLADKQAFQAVVEEVLSLPYVPEKKISSHAPRLLLALKQAPKVIRQIKQLHPDAILVGFKLLSDVSAAELLTAGQGLMTKNQCDFVLMNDLKSIQDDHHQAILLSATGEQYTANTKPEIAKLIVKQVSEKWKEKQT